MKDLMRRLAGGVSLFLAACATGSAPDAAPAEPPPPAAAQQQPAGLLLPDGGRHLRAQQVRMRDGVRLNADVWLPAAEGRFPVVLIRTPYETEVGRRPVFLNRALEAGYAVMQSHERGRYLSEGEMRMLGRADEDGWDTLEWIAAQPWSDGKVATYGCSSSAENQLKLASLAHPAHRAMIAYSAGVGVAEAGAHKEQGNFWRGGVWQQGWMDYFFSSMGTQWPQLPAGLSDAEREQLVKQFTVRSSGPGLDDADYDRARMHLPMIDIPNFIGAPANELSEYLARGPHHPAWAEDRVVDADVIRVPGLWAEALYDISTRSTVAFFEKTRAENPDGTQTIVITNGRHCAFERPGPQDKIGDRPLGDMSFDFAARQLAWLDRWMKDDAPAETAAALPAAPVTAYMAGVNRWVDFASVPQAGRDPSRAFFFSSGGNANTLNGDGVLLAAAAASAAADSFAYDPANPVISNGGEISGVGTDQRGKDGAFDQREIQQRADVLVYTSEPLTEDLAVFGFIETELFVSSDAPDTDFTVKLVDVAPDGTAWNISDTILRMRYREGLDRETVMQPGETYRISPPPMIAANVFLKGHRVRVEVSSSAFPYYARNLNTAENPYTTTDFRVANNTVRHGPEMLSKILLPVVELE